MTTRVRLLPVVICATAVLLSLKLGAVAAGPEKPAEQPAPEAPAEHAPVKEGEAKPAEAAAPAGEGTATAEAKPAAAEHAPAPKLPEQAQTKGEAEVYRVLGERRAALDARERDLALREKMLGISEKGVEAKLAELKALEQQLNAMLAQRDQQEEVQLASLVKTYESMKPVDAAKIFNKLDRKVLVDVASRMKPVKIGAVMAAMEPQRAQELTVMLAMRLRTQAPVLPAPSQPLAPAAAAAPIATPPAPVAADTAPLAPTPAAAGPAPVPTPAAAPDANPHASGENPAANAAPHG